MANVSSAYPRQRRIGLTGGIATGKSTVSQYLATHHHLPVFDADLYAREAVAPGSQILARISDRYGSTMLLANGQLDRARLGQRVFQDAEERGWLEAQIHPYVRDRIVQTCTETVDQPIVVVAIPLLFEAQMTDLVTEVWVVTCTLEQQVQRLMARNGLTEKDSCDRIHSQMSLATKIARADVVLDNSQDPDHLWPQINHALSHS